MRRGRRVPESDIHDPYGRAPSAYAWEIDGRIVLLPFADMLGGFAS